MYNTLLCIIRQKPHLPSELVWDGEIASVVETVNVVKKLINNSWGKDKGNLSPFYFHYYLSKSVYWDDFRKIVKICYNLYVASKDELGRNPGFPLCFGKDWASHIGHVWGVSYKQGRLASPPLPPPPPNLSLHKTSNTTNTTQHTIQV
jgi:hypothetical protein